LRGDVQPISIGESTVVQDLVTIKSFTGSGPVKIGRHAYVGANARLGSCTVQDFAFVSMGATVEDGAVVESYGLLAAGARLAAGGKVASGQVWAGSPAAYLRDITTEEREAMTDSLSELRHLAKVHFEETEKSFEEIFSDDIARNEAVSAEEGELTQERFRKLGYADSPHDVQEMEFVHGHEYINIDPRPHTEVKTWKPFTEDGQVFPEAWKVYSEDYSRYERARAIFEKPTPEAVTPSYDQLPRNSTPWTKRY
jgi:carbonic anhydrase/acetyltransferase-like protein (isoleucine patch superfamily)